MGKIKKLLELCLDISQPVLPKDTNKVVVEEIKSLGTYIIDVGILLNSNRFEAIKNRILSRQVNGIRISVFQVGPRHIECRLDSPEMSERINKIASSTAGDIERMLGELKNIKEKI